MDPIPQRDAGIQSEPVAVLLRHPPSLKRLEPSNDGEPTADGDTRGPLNALGYRSLPHGQPVAGGLAVIAHQQEVASQCDGVPGLVAEDLQAGQFTRPVRSGMQQD